MTLGLALSSYYSHERSFYIDEVHNVVDKYEGLLRGPNAEERIAEYTKQIRDRSEYRALVRIRYQLSALLYIIALD